VVCCMLGTPLRGSPACGVARYKEGLDVTCEQLTTRSVL